MKFTTKIESDYRKLAVTPTKNKKALIDFAASDFDTIKDRLIQYIQAVYPTEYTYFSESDLGIMLLELISYMGAVNSLKADLLANENYLETAQQRESVAKLLRLVGVSLKGPLSAAAEGRITFETSSTSYDIGIADRVFTATSPQDGTQLTYTMYKVVNGSVDTANTDGSITLNDIEADPTEDGEDPRVFSNVVLQEGALVTDTGDFTNTEATKKIELPEYPVIEGSINVYINSQDTDVDGPFTEVESIYMASGSSDKIFEVVYDSDFKATLVFGDGIIGTSPGVSDTYFVTYRTGGGAKGNLATGGLQGTVQANAASTPVTGNLVSTTPATGGSDAETIEHAKKWAPLTFARQDRLVTLEDYVSFSNTFITTLGTVGKATATTRKGYASANVIDLYVLEKASDIQLQKATPNFKIDLLTAMNEKKMITDDIVISDGLIRTLDLVVSITLDKRSEPNESEIVSKVRDKILEYFSVDNMEFGEGLNISDLNRDIYEVDEVRFSVIENLDKDIELDFNEIIQLNNLTITTEYTK